MTRREAEGEAQALVQEMVAADVIPDWVVDPLVQRLATALDAACQSATPPDPAMVREAADRLAAAVEPLTAEVRLVVSPVDPACRCGTCDKVLALEAALAAYRAATGGL